MKSLHFYWSFLAAYVAIFLGAVTAQDPNMCEALGGERFTCRVNNEMSFGDTTTAVASTINCKLDPAIGMNFLEADDCVCRATLTTADTSKICNCAVCPSGTVSLDCSVGADDPFISENCRAMDCNGNCVDSGIPANLDTTPPDGGKIPRATDPTAAPTTSTTTTTSGCSWAVGSYQHMLYFVTTGLFILLA